MKFTQSAFTSDHLQLTRWELLKLFFGCTLRRPLCAIVVECRKKKTT